MYIKSNGANPACARRALSGVPRQLTKAFFEQLERKLGGSLVHVCCKCNDNSALDSNALILVNEDCATLGRSWHRLMMRQPDDSLVLAIPLDKNRTV
jgi:hypothetical protein